ncbi:response regulator [Desulfonatronovibrio magnus]|uniref:response regulator n=1 Tax=Desulfonatronovibrio magnus TaxID=698827 RepID=UPI0005EB1CB4|nr:response regulator [Desulfonatronovibrio magnus]
MSTKTILIIDDESDFRFSMSLILKAQGFNIIEAGDGIEALEKLSTLQEQNKNVALIVTDLRMPGMGGIELLERLSRHNNEIKVLVITGYGDRETTNRIKKMGYSQILNKPFSAEVLINQVNYVLSENY